MTASAAKLSSRPLCSAAPAYLSVRFLLRYFETRTLIPFAVWSLGFGAARSLYFIAN